MENKISNKYLEMDNWTDEQVSLFKENAKKEEQQRKLTRVIEPKRLTGPSIPEMIIAEGDSWFDYMPGTDIIDCLRNHYGYVIDNYAKAGDTLENMIYGTGINKRFERVSPTIDKVLRRIGEVKPKIFLFSGGGNDVAGEEFESYLNHKNSGLTVLREQFLRDMINNVFKKYFQDLIGKIEEVSPETHILVHGYGKTAPTGEGVELLFFSFAGPWLKPALAKKGIFDFNEQRRAVFTLIDEYNAMLAELARHHPNFHYVDLREMIDPDRDWVNELHLRNSAYARVAERIHNVIQSL